MSNNHENHKNKLRQHCLSVEDATVRCCLRYPAAEISSVYMLRTDKVPDSEHVFVDVVDNRLIGPIDMLFVLIVKLLRSPRRLH